MRKSILLLVIIVFISCSKNKDNSDATLNVTNSEWYTTIIWGTTNVNGFGIVKLVISGSTNADKVTVRTYGDGLISDQNIMLDSNKSFNRDTVAISFIHFSGVPPSGEFERNTIIKAYKGTDTLVVTLYSGKLKY